MAKQVRGHFTLNMRLNFIGRRETGGPLETFIGNPEH